MFYLFAFVSGAAAASAVAHYHVVTRVASLEARLVGEIAKLRKRL